MNKIPQLLRDARKRKKITQKALAEKMGVFQNQISQYESDDKQITSGTIEKMCDALGVEVVLQDKPTTHK